MKKLRIHLFLVFLLAGAWTMYQNDRPTIYIIGDSTVKNGNGTGSGGLWGWGNFLTNYFDSTKIRIENCAHGGTSSRTFQTYGFWNEVLTKIRPGDFVFMQFGHNDGGPLDDTARARGTIRGIGNESQVIYNPITRTMETVYTYGWYMRKFINDTRAKGATPVVCSPVPRNNWKDGKIIRDTTTYAKWAGEVANAEGVGFIPLNQLVCDQYDKLGEAIASVTMYTTTDHTHSSLEGAKLNVVCVIEGLKKLKDNPLLNYLKPETQPLNMTGLTNPAYISLYPQPAVDIAILKGSNMQEVSIYNFLGILMMKVNLQGKDEASLNVSGLKPGIYMVHIRMNGYKVNNLKLLKR